MNRLRKGDDVVVLAGKDKGKEGTISKVLPKENKVIVDGINVAKRHTKATQTRGPMKTDSSRCVGKLNVTGMPSSL